MEKTAKIILIFAVFCQLIFWAVFVHAQEVQAPETLEKVKEIGKEALNKTPGVIEKVWQEAKNIFSFIGQWLKGFWGNYISPWLKSIWQKIASFLNKKVEERKPGVEKEFKKEKEEMIKEIPKTSKSLWQRFKEIIK